MESTISRLKQKYTRLTDDDLLFAQGKHDESIGRLGKKLGKTKEEIGRTFGEM